MRRQLPFGCCLLAGTPGVGARRVLFSCLRRFIKERHVIFILPSTIQPFETRRPDSYGAWPSASLVSSTHCRSSAWGVNGPDTVYRCCVGPEKSALVTSLGQLFRGLRLLCRRNQVIVYLYLAPRSSKMSCRRCWSTWCCFGLGRWAFCRRRGCPVARLCVYFHKSCSPLSCPRWAIRSLARSARIPHASALLGQRGQLTDASESLPL